MTNSHVVNLAQATANSLDAPISDIRGCIDPPAAQVASMIAMSVPSQESQVLRCS